MIEIKNLYKTFQVSAGTVEALKDVNLTIPDGDIFGIIGMSGAGKSTLVRCINMLERPTSGQVLMDGRDIGALSEAELRNVRKDVTMIFQGFNLLMQRSVLRNVCFPMELLKIVGLESKADAYPAQLSGGQQQRVAIARALATDPKVLLCDEATSALDPNTTHSILELIRQINEQLGITVIIITHQMSVVEDVCRHVAILDGGVVVEQGNVSEVFARPQSAAARRLVFPEGESGTVIAGNPEEKLIRVVFNGANATGKPLIATMAMEKGIAANICYASTRNIGERTFGSMLLGITGSDEKVKEAMAYLQQVPDVLAEEVSVNV